MRLIDADVLKREVVGWLRPVVDESNMVDGDDVAVSVIMTIEEAPTIDPYRHGKWIASSFNGYLCCSECKDCFIVADWLQDGKWNWCPNCGA